MLNKNSANEIEGIAFVQSPKLKSTIITSQLPIDKWHQYLGEPTIADAILDRILQNVNRIEMGGESMRKRKNIDAS